MTKQVHELSAVDLTVTRGWHSMDTFPRSGDVVEVADAKENVGTGKWWGGAPVTDIKNPVKWRRHEP